MEKLQETQTKRKLFSFIDGFYDEEKTKEELEREATAKRIEEYLKNAHRIKDKFEPILRKIWPEIDTITVYELIEDVKNLDFEGCDCLIKLKDGTKIHAALRENTGGDDWYTQASMLRRNSVRKHEGKAIQSIEIQIFKENNQIHILDSDEVYKIAYEFQKQHKFEGFCDKLNEKSKEMNVNKYEVYKFAHWITKDGENNNSPEKEDAIRIKYIGYENFIDIKNLKELKKIEVLKKWEKYDLEGNLIKRGSLGVDLHAEYYKQKTQKLEEMFPEETRLVDEKETKQQQQENFMTNSEIKNIDLETIQELSELNDIKIGYNPESKNFILFDSKSEQIHLKEQDIGDLIDRIDDKIVQILDYNRDTIKQEVQDLFEELYDLKAEEETFETYTRKKDIKQEILEFAQEISEEIDFGGLVEKSNSLEKHKNNNKTYAIA